MSTYAIIDATGGWLINLVLWDGDLETWQPPEGTNAVLADTIDINSLPPNPQNVALYTAEEWLKKEGYDATQLVTFTDMERQLAAAGKTSAKMTAVRAWANSILAEYVATPESKPSWTPAPFNFNEAITEAFNALQ